MPRIPDLPGNLIPPHSEQERWLKRHVAALCHLEHERFPGSQPVSFAAKDLDRLEEKDFWVAEKSDGVRVLLLVCPNPFDGEQTVYLIDRHNSYRQLEGLYFPHHENPAQQLRNTLVDGELVIDVDPHSQHEKLRYLAFDCLIVDNQYVMDKNLESRYGRLRSWMYKPYQQMMRDHPRMAQSQPFEFKVKDVRNSYSVEGVFNIDIPALQHGNDGLIFTCVSTTYAPGTDPNILKWKPPSENSIDFKLVLRFPPAPGKPKTPDFQTKPVFELHVWCGDVRYEPYDVMHVEDEEWESMKLSNKQLDEQIVEVHWDIEGEVWRMMRFRNDKPHGNHKSVVDNIIKSIADGVEKDVLLLRSQAIRNNWKLRHGEPTGGRPPPNSLPQKPVTRPPLPTPTAHLPTPPPPPPPHVQHQPPPQSHADAPPAPAVAPRYARLAPSPWSKVTGPSMIGGMYR
ncbi:mRNA capping enzyme, catalytic domain-containing protein [Epithele typhae]|uniref:mRNA capping enzyme, catalytic domain-containing protein n=1 Tax=Epithele typhae TaxID=378194 RepID=UPI002008C717|nr:mRNA capping enzyme, catalytic domain-containing protein [Epithele typhae]KAH9945882.1 mRNA capping enzyme, catalytic domain-containing protein [Epithele typhae]